MIAAVLPFLERNFSGAAAYRGRFTTPNRTVCEPLSEPFHLPPSERHLQCTWFDARYRPSRLLTDEGEPVQVLSPGLWNLESGPDFLDAELLVGESQRHVRGDIEIHVRPSDWNAHHHAGNPAYDRLAAHVTYLPGRLAATAIPPGVLQLSLSDALRHDPYFFFETIDVGAYPYASSGAAAAPCGERLSTWTEDERAQLLDAAGEERLRTRASRLAERMGCLSAEQVFYEEIMHALGYKQNREPFRRLARTCALTTLTEESTGDAARAYALLLGVSGLLPDREKAGWDHETGRLLRSLWDHWWKIRARWQDRRLPGGRWVFSGLRPTNHPLRRLAAAAALFSQASLLERMRAIPTHDPKPWFRQAAGLFAVAGVLPYWDHRVAWNGKRSPRPVQLLGKTRIAAILANVCVPFLAAEGQDVTALLPALPAEGNHILIRRTAFSLFGADHNATLYRQGLRRQGLVQIAHDFCLNTRRGCTDCPLLPSLTP